MSYTNCELDMKMRRIEVSKPDGSAKIIQLVPEEKALAILTLIKEEPLNDDDELIDAMDDMPEQKDPKHMILVRFKNLRNRTDMTQEELAQKLGITQAEVSKIETGKRAIGKKLAKKIEKVFKMDYRRFL